ncbi:hypothetical protein WPS_05760 [Vulcanimicrobium alpinum]|uniref:Uncharacterized protein n=1 Tax=Vulcanimicrobium alpinum TaxID=3016050 RepID=A0AAN1XT84_UNVUL|nr:hypothetical protein [Vulcanimicrobium alpinum]BDE05300.1 hypothetical protein WPS_05760 [Vulcanimicrobium alpinum]
MSTVRERIYLEAPFTEAAGALERRLGLERDHQHGRCELTLVVPSSEGRELARVVVAET